MKDLIVKFNQDSSLQKIKAAYLDDSVKLTDSEEKLLEQLRYIFSLRLKNKFTKQQAIEKFMSEYGVSRATAYRYYSKSIFLFGELDEIDIKAEKLVVAEQYWFLYQMQLRDRNWDAAKKTMDSYAALFDFSKSEMDVDPDKIKANNYRISISRAFYAYMKEKSAQGVVDMNMNAEDIEFEELAENGDDG